MYLRTILYRTSVLVLFIVLTINTDARKSKDRIDITFTLSVEAPASHLVHIAMQYEGAVTEETIFKMPVWTPGYYQIMNYADQVMHFTATDLEGKPLPWEKISPNTWKIKNGQQKKILLSYDVKGERAFVASNYIDEERAYLSPAGVLLYPEGLINHPSTLIIKPFGIWNTVATGLEMVTGKVNTYTAPDFDVLYDSPILMGSKLETLPAFEVRGVPHYFVGYNMGTFDRQQFVADLKKIVESAVNIMGDIPYKHYTFLDLGPGNGGIEHLNSASISFSGQSLNQPASRIRTYSFLAHEYFHHYNVKRIRPIELGPFDYDKGSPTKMLWVSEGITVYYEYMVLRRAGLMSEEDVFKALKTNILAYEGKPGRLYQSLTDASYNTWSDGPFGRTGDDVNKTISYYDKGPVVGAMLDLAIRHASKNKKSLDDVMRSLYNGYYLKKKRGFTEDEFRSECEKAAGVSLTEVFEYTSTVKELDYEKYFKYAGLEIDLKPQTIPAYLGLTVRERGDSLSVTDVDWDSPAWKAGIRRRDLIVNNENSGKLLGSNFRQMLSTKKTGDEVVLKVFHQQKEQTLHIILGEKTEKSFDIKPSADAGGLESAIRKDWLRGS